MHKHMHHTSGPITHSGTGPGTEQNGATADPGVADNSRKSTKNVVHSGTGPGSERNGATAEGDNGGTTTSGTTRTTRTKAKSKSGK
ncbi:MAG: hypothetical protein H0W12_09775 [Chitinophagaceae bacterium]|nr:hypothetical protein [Chitinophagaceae bacterium]